MKSIRMIKRYLSFALLFFLLIGNKITAQNQKKQTFSISEENVKKFYPYLEFMYGKETLENMKRSNPAKYYYELWYHCESFYIKRNALKEGIPLNEEIIDIKRFEQNRKEKTEVEVTLPGFKDLLVLKPKEELKKAELYFKNNYK